MHDIIKRHTRARTRAQEAVPANAEVAAEPAEPAPAEPEPAPDCATPPTAAQALGLEITAPWIAPAEGLRSALIVSPPGMGKTTLLRDLARQLSASGRSVALADERRELAACHRGVPTLDVGPRTDVMDGGPKAEAIGRMIRSMAPDVIVADEIGGEGEARALADAARCGTAIVASAHGGGIGEVLNRPGLREVLTFGVVERIMLLGPTPGAVRGAWRREPGEGESAWKPA